MRVLLHICCAPCALFPVKELKAKGHEVMGYFYNPNIHPYTEYRKRLETLEDWAASSGLRLIVEDDYDPEAWFRRTAFREGMRCSLCYHQRLSRAAAVAKRGRFDALCTTLLYSKQQKHDQLTETARSVCMARGVEFLYQDFRPGWQEGIKLSKELGLYRQQYCGCIFSERDRYKKRSSKGHKKENP